MESLWIIVVLVASSWTSLINGEEYNKAEIGTLKTNAHAVAGEVYALSPERLYITGFSYDGTGPDAFWYIGTEGNVPSHANGIKIPDEKGSDDILGRYNNADIMLKLPNNIKVRDIKWISVWCRKFKVDFGSLVFPTSVLNIPAPVDVGDFIPKGHSTSSGKVILLDTRRVLIEAMKYDGLGPDAFFWVGTSNSPDASGKKIPDESGSLDIAKAYDGSKDITLTLPEDMSFNDLRWLSLYCITYTENFGHVLIPENMNLPTYIEPEKINCHQLHKRFNVGWKITGDDIEFTLTGALGTDGYMAFGLSGSDTASVMGGGDVAVVYHDSTDMPIALDYTLQSYALCSGSQGVCPDTGLGGQNSLTVVHGSTSEGVTAITYSRKLITGDTNDRNIPESGEVYVIWAMGKINQDGKVTKHDLRLQGNLKLDFGRSTSDTCMEVEGETDDGKGVVPWNQMYLSGENKKVFRARMGPAGGKKGYTGLTGENSWGLAWYLEGMLIPYLVVRRGETYTFVVEGGDNTANTAEYHPFYITNDRVGGYTAKTDKEKSDVKIYAGPETGQFCEYKVSSSSTKDPESYDNFDDYFNTLEPHCAQGGKPGELTWTPDSDTPDMLYYQCYTHQLLGWKIRVVNDYSEFDFMNGSNTVHISLLTLIACFFGIVLSAF